MLLIVGCSLRLRLNTEFTVLAVPDFAWCSVNYGRKLGRMLG